MARPFLWLGKRLAYIALAVAGALLALFAYSKIATADLLEGDNLGKYTYTSSDCHEPDADARDPINVVFWHDASPWALWYYFEQYHGWVNNGGETQYFQTNGSCSVMDGQPSSAAAGLSRYHARHQRGLDATGEVDFDPIWGDYSVAAARYEDWVIGGGCGSGDYAVPEDGFDQGRDKVIENWVTEPDPGHTLWGYGYWDNLAPRVQCNGAQAASDGYVAFIQAWLDSDGDGLDNFWEVSVIHTDPFDPDTDADGCMDGEDLDMSFDPLDPWDFYDVPAPARPDPTPNGDKNRAVNTSDVLAVLFYVPTSDGGPPNANGVDYDSDKNGDTTKDGVDYDRSPSAAPNPPWDAGPPNGVINISDVLANLAQVPLACSGPPD
jgi:hypothetical protein